MTDPLDRHDTAAARGCAVGVCLGGCIFLALAALIVWAVL
jgi:hypothetical protein